MLVLLGSFSRSGLEGGVLFLIIISVFCVNKADSANQVLPIYRLLYHARPSVKPLGCK